MEIDKTKQSEITVTYECDNDSRSCSCIFNYPIAHIDFPCDIAEMFIKMTIGLHKSPPRNIVLYLNGVSIWDAIDFETANIK